MLKRKLSNSDIDGFFTNDLDNFLQNLSISQNYPNSYCISDISLGAWKAHQIAIEFFLQLSEKEQFTDIKSETVQASKEQLSFANLVGTGIDNEARGDIYIDQTFTYVNDILKEIYSLPKTFIILTTQKNKFNCLENVFFIQLFAQVIIPFGSKCIIVSDLPYEVINLKIIWKNNTNSVSKIDQTGELSILNDCNLLIPGIVPPSIELSDYKELSHSYKLIPFSYRKNYNQQKLNYDKLAISTSEKWIKAYAQYFGNIFFIDAPFLMNYAWQQFYNGSQDIALRYLEKTFRVSTDNLQKAIISTQLQGIRISKWLFEDVAQHPDPVDPLPNSIKNFLMLAKAWGNIMVNNIENAHKYISYLDAQISIDGVNSLEYCYFLNIKALFFFKKNDFKTALNIENNIEFLQKEYNLDDFRLKFVNSINTARLYRKLNHVEQAEKYYNKAFETNKCLRTESELTYMNLQLASLAKTKECIADEYLLLIKAGLSWIINPTPENITKRVEKLIDFSLLNSFENLPIALTNHLIFAISKHQLYPKEQKLDTIPIFISEANVTKADMGIGKHGLGVFIAYEPSCQNFIDEDCFNELRKVLFLSISAYIGFPFKPNHAIICPHQGNNIIETYEDLLICGALLAVEKYYWNDVLLNIHPAKILPQLKLKLHCGIKKISCSGSNSEVQFKRYLPDQTLNQAESILLKQILSENVVIDVLNKETINLINKKIISFYLASE